MSITDELRKWAEGGTLRAGMSLRTARDQALAIADRIDSEHERQLEVLYRDMSDAEWVRLPLDADGVPIRFGDKVTVPWSEKVYEVSGFSYTQQLARGERTIWVDVYSLEKMRNVPLCGADSCHHYHAPTVEDVLRQFAHVGIRIAAKHGIEAGEIDFYADEEAIAEFAAKLRLADDRKEQ